mmetsp:Transcript_10269/g.10333  ORF Transcript_10269/g.10333 Transcript_10269/m.10333 type:complete len:391 (-) Transcript_10269:434-1606(-)|eukprot:CAMPEP_0182434824 /NCGR_PEP_ID=MMETSP1167-20130531/72024_1 /TAXON_ID=2988 /ORGANISM="Mallomonas Sp, Strain CCMP3275" /LENGTH=390 /DNA_ID=CAMNT_0024625135 /DNA_START=272 /DNA_END=1444 /DNA_ORIENTATION=-
MGSITISARNREIIQRKKSETEYFSRAVDQFLHAVLSHPCFFATPRFAASALFENTISANFYVQYITTYHSNMLEMSKLFSDIDLKEMYCSDLTDKLRYELSNSKDNFLDTLSQATISLFLKSSFFFQWRTAEIKETLSLAARAKAVPTATLPDLEFPSTASTGAILRTATAVYCDAEVQANVMEFIYHSDSAEDDIVIDTAEMVPNSGISCDSTAKVALSSCDQIELPKLLTSHCWLSILMTASETMPAAVTISKVNDSDCKYPLVYVNKFFESISGRKRSNMVGEPGTFLQTSTTLRAPGQVDTLSNLNRSIKRNDRSTVMLICDNKSRGMFRNMIGVKPVFDHNTSRVAYVITIQAEIKSESTIDNVRSFVLMMLSSLEDEQVFHRH